MSRYVSGPKVSGCGKFGKWKLGVKLIKLYIFIHVCIQYCNELTIVIYSE